MPSLRVKQSVLSNWTPWLLGLVGCAEMSITTNLRYKFIINVMLFPKRQ